MIITNDINNETTFRQEGFIDEKVTIADAQVGREVIAQTESSGSGDSITIKYVKQALLR